MAIPPSPLPNLEKPLILFSYPPPPPPQDHPVGFKFLL
uniref:Uncharacterized protein n=1 Tax=Arundo donax TaxID=35708 RepID=A0A0A9DRS9_ARUDO